MRRSSSGRCVDRARVLHASSGRVAGSSWRAPSSSAFEKGLSQHAGQRVGAMDRGSPRAGAPRRRSGAAWATALVEQPLGLEPLLQDVGHEGRGTVAAA